MPLYTPFFERSMQTIEGGRQRRDVGRAASAAYMGGPEEMAALYQQSPQLAEDMQRTRLQQEQVQGQRQQAQAQADERARVAARQRASDEAQRAERSRVSTRQAASDVSQTEQRERQRQQNANNFYQNLSEEVSKIDDFETAKDYAGIKLAASGFDELFDLEQFTPEQHEQYKEVFAERDRDATQRTDRIGALTTMLSSTVENPEELATKMVDGLLEIEVSEDAQTVIMTDKVKLLTDPANAVTNLPIGSLNLDEPRAQPQQGQTLYELAQDVGGVSGGVKQLLSNVAGQFGFEAFPEEMEAYQTLNTAVGDMTRSLMVGDRWTVGQANMLREEIDIKPGILSPGPLTNMRMRSIDRSLKLRLQQFQRDADDNSLTQQERSMQRANSATIRNFIDLLGVPEKIEVESVTMETVSDMPINDVNQFINNATDEELNSLPDQVVEMLFERRTSGR